MADVFVDRAFSEPMTPAAIAAEAAAARDTLAACGVGWHGALLARGGRRALCRLSAPDPSAVRHAYRLLGVPMRGLWYGLSEAAKLPALANVAVERYSTPMQREPAPAWCLATHRVVFAGTLVSLDRMRCIELFEAPDAESVRLARGANADHGDRVWAFEQLAAPPWCSTPSAG
jgi:hypothetical protein